MSRHGNLTSAALSSSGIRCWQGFPFTPRSGRTTTSRTPASRCSSCSLFWPKTCPPSRGDVLMARRRRLRPFASDWRDGWSTSRRRRRGFDALSHGLKRSAPARKQTRLTDVECGQTGEAGSAGRRRVADTAPCATTAANARSGTPMQSDTGACATGGRALASRAWSSSSTRRLPREPLAAPVPLCANSSGLRRVGWRLFAAVDSPAALVPRVARTVHAAALAV
jgi:hypothetical protein